MSEDGEGDPRLCTKLLASAVFVLMVLGVLSFADIPRLHGAVSVRFLVVPPVFLFGRRPVEPAPSFEQLFEVIEERHPGCDVELTSMHSGSVDSRSLMDSFETRTLEIRLVPLGGPPCDALGRWRIHLENSETSDSPHPAMWHLVAVQQGQPPLWGGLFFRE